MEVVAEEYVYNTMEGKVTVEPNPHRTLIKDESGNELSSIELGEISKGSNTLVKIEVETLSTIPSKGVIVEVVHTNAHPLTVVELCKDGTFSKPSRYLRFRELKEGVSLSVFIRIKVAGDVNPGEGQVSLNVKKSAES